MEPTSYLVRSSKEQGERTVSATQTHTQNKTGKRPFNFSAGPGTLPEEVLEKAKEEMLDWNGTGISVMEMSHRSKEYVSIAEQAEADCREVLSIPDSYKVLFLQGGASGQFAAIPMNLLHGKDRADYVVTGFWSQKAYEEAQKYCKAGLVASGEDDSFQSIPAESHWRHAKGAAYLHYTDNETIHGIEFPYIPKSDAPLVVDVSSNIFSKPLDVSKFALVYAGAQKNFGPAGLTLVIVHEDCLGKALSITPSIFDYTGQAAAGSMVNTPPTYSWYIAGLTFKWLKKIGGVKEMEKRNKEKASILYKQLDGAKYFENRVKEKYRSLMNVPFFITDEALAKDPDLEKKFLAQAAKRGLLTLAGHRSVGGMRASIYNAMPKEGVQALADFIAEFDETIK